MKGFSSPAGYELQNSVLKYFFSFITNVKLNRLIGKKNSSDKCALKMEC